MELGFSSYRDMLSVLLAPIVGGAVAVAWPWLVTFQRKLRFEALIVRELKEIGPVSRPNDASFPVWTDYQPKHFVHKQVFENPSLNRDFILSLDPTLSYHVSLLWDAHRRKDHKEWLYHLKELNTMYRGGKKLLEVQKAWITLIASIHEPSPK